MGEMKLNCPNHILVKRRKNTRVPLPFKHPPRSREDGVGWKLGLTLCVFMVFLQWKFTVPVHLVDLLLSTEDS